jgi:SAM-dependent methyltransferase
MDKSHLNPITRFSSRTENYLKYRPHYPDEIINHLKKENVLNKKSIIADIGSGTGFSSELFLKNGNTVYGVEPNKEMREAGEKYLSGYKNFISINGTAENTTLKSGSIDIIAAGQAFHWFNFSKTRDEFRRITKPDGYLVLIWNVRRFTDAGFGTDYERMLIEFGTDYKEVEHKTITKSDYDNFYPGICKTENFLNKQMLDFDGLKGRLLSSSYSPDENSPNYKPMLNRLKEIFDKHHINGTVEMKYTTEVYYGKIFENTSKTNSA